MSKQVRYLIHPGLAQASLEEADEKFRAAVDTEMAYFWIARFWAAMCDEAEEKSQLVVIAGLRSAPYLIRQNIWDEASYFLEEVIYRDGSPKTIASVLPLLRHITKLAIGTDLESEEYGILAKVLLKGGRMQEAEDTIRLLIPRFVSKGNFKGALKSAGDLFDILIDTGRFTEALKITEMINDYTRQAGLGPWTQLMQVGYMLRVMIFQESSKKSCCRWRI